MMNLISLLLNHICRDIVKGLWDGNSMDLRDLMAVNVLTKYQNRQIFSGSYATTIETICRSGSRPFLGVVLPATPTEPLLQITDL
jgi:hypothetical protein